MIPTYYSTGICRERKRAVIVPPPALRQDRGTGLPGRYELRVGGRPRFPPFPMRPGRFRLASPRPGRPSSPREPALSKEGL